MQYLDPQAEELNGQIQKGHPAIYALLSERGKRIFFPKLGIVKQSLEAKGKKIDATIGIAIEDNGLPMRFSSIEKWLKLDPNEAFPYASSYGKTELRKWWQEHIRKENPSLQSSITLPIVTCALTHGLSVAGYLFVDPADKILVPDKYWENYTLIFENTYGAGLAHFNFFKNDRMDIEAFSKALAQLPNKKIVLLTFPNNPTGYTPTEQEARQLAECLIQEAQKGNPVLALIDDAYFGLVYEQGIFKESLFSLLANAHENLLAVKIDGATKEAYVWGFRVGFLTYGIKGLTSSVAQALEDKTAGAVRATISNAPHLSQSLVFKGLSSPEYEIEKKEKFALLKKRYETTKQILKANPQYREVFIPLPFNSGYFMCIQLQHGLDGEKVRQRLLQEYDIGVIAFGNLLRIAFSAVKEEVLPFIFDSVYKVCKEML